jgi:hypothetical protein
LLVDTDGTPNHMFPADPLADTEELRKAGGWMRAVSPGGRVAYEGETPWSESAGVGLRPGEPGQAPVRPLVADLPEFLTTPSSSEEGHDLDENGPDGTEGEGGSVAPTLGGSPEGEGGSIAPTLGGSPPDPEDQMEGGS